jgi:hypothetical protein
MYGALSEQPPAPVKMRNALGWWWHTPHDTLDKIDEGNLVRDTRIYVHTLHRLLTDPVLPIDFAAHAKVLLGELVRGAKVRATADFSLAPIRRCGFFATCAASIRPFRAEPCRA